MYLFITCKHILELCLWQTMSGGCDICKYMAHNNFATFLLKIVKNVKYKSSYTLCKK